MKSSVQDLVNMQDYESLYEIMEENDDWLTRLDAAEGLVKLGDHRGLEYILVCLESDDPDIVQAAKELLDDPDLTNKRLQIESELRFENQKLIETAKERLAKGKKVFLHKVVRLSLGDFAFANEVDHGFEIFDLNDLGLEGWEVVTVLPARHLVDPGMESKGGVFVFLRKELGPDEAGELEKS